jgi:hypothetical protein
MCVFVFEGGSLKLAYKERTRSLIRFIIIFVAIMFPLATIIAIIITIIKMEILG